MNIQDKLTAVNQRYKELERNCQDYINNYDNDSHQVRSLNYFLAGKTLDLEQRLDIVKKLKPLENRQKKRAQEYVRQQRLKSKIQMILQSIDKLKMHHENVKRLKAKVDRERKELIRVQQSIENYEGQCRTGLQKIEAKLDHLWRVSKSNEFVG